MKLALGLAIALAASGQEATVVAPDAYKLIFENDWVRVLRVHYAPHATIPVHRHPATPTIFVYLDDAGPVRFSHKGDHPSDVVRPPVKAGGIRVTSGAEEVHVVESLSDTPDDSLRIEMKTQNPEGGIYNQRIPPEAPAPAEPYVKVRFENRQFKITQAVCNPHVQCGDLEAGGSPGLLVSLGASGATLAAGTTKPLALAHGEAFWLEPGPSTPIANAGETTARFLWITLKTQPLHVK
jgi:hypothetical protein